MPFFVLRAAFWHELADADDVITALSSISSITTISKIKYLAIILLNIVNDYILIAECWKRTTTMYYFYPLLRSASTAVNNLEWKKNRNMVLMPLV